MSILTSVSESFPRILLGTLGLLFLMTLIFVEQKVQAPVFDVSLFRDRVFWSSILSGFFVFVAYSSVAVLLPLFLEEVLQMPTHQTGMWLMTIPVVMLIVAPISGRLSDRVGSKELCLAGAFILAITLLIMAGLFGLGFHQKVPQTGLFFALVAIGLAMGLFQSPNNNAIMGAVPMKKLGAASALIGSIRNLGAVTGAGLATGVFSWRFAEGGNFVDALHLTFMVSGLVALSGLVASLGKTQENS
jgi:MFS family permease